MPGVSTVEREHGNGAKNPARLTACPRRPFHENHVQRDFHFSRMVDVILTLKPDPVSVRAEVVV